MARYRRIERQKFLLRWLRLVKPQQRALLRIVYDLGFLGGAKRTLTEAAKQMGFTREYARQIHDSALLRILAVPEDLPDLFAGSKNRIRKHIEQSNHKFRARQITHRAIKAGKLTRQPCTRCAAPDAEAHHPDYNKPLDIEWLCKKCHSKEHAALRAA